MKEFDMKPYENYFSELEKLFYEKNAHMNIVAYMSDKNIFSDDQYNRVFSDYVKSLRSYEDYIKIFEDNVIIPVCGAGKWTADFERRVVYID